MYGYVRPSLERLTEEDRKRFSSVYCGLCHALGQRYGTASRFILNYDFTFLALLLSGEEESREHRRCMAHPVRGKDIYPVNDALLLSADCSVILAWWQLQDSILDGDKGGTAKYRAAAVALRSAYNKAQRLRPKFDMAVRNHLKELDRLEKERCPSLDRPANEFACILRSAVDDIQEPVESRVLGELLYHLGRWIYLVDAADDLKDDFESGSYNPLICRFSLETGELTEEARDCLILSLDNSVRRMCAAYELWDFGVWSPIIRAVVYEGLYLVGRAVLEGTFQAEAGHGPSCSRIKETS